MTKKIKVLIIIICIFAAAAGVFSLIMISRAAEINGAITKFGTLDGASITCVAKQKYYVFRGTEGKVEQEDEGTFLYAYRKNSEGYDLTCNSFSIKDNYIYMGNKRAYISDKDAVEKYEGVFIRHDNNYAFYPVTGRQMLVYDPTEIAEAIQKYLFSFISKSVKGTVTEYNLYLGNNFYGYILRNAYAGYSTREISSKFFEPLTLTVENGIIKTISFSVKGYFFTTDTVGNKYTVDKEYFCNITYSDDCEIASQDESVPQGFYRAVVPQKIAEAGNGARIAFYKGKAFCVDGSGIDGNGTLLKIYDLKSGNIEKVKSLSLTPHETASQIFVKDGYVYVDTAYGIAYEYDAIQDAVRSINGIVTSFSEDGVYVNIDGVKFFGKDFDELSETDNGNHIIYHAESNRYYSRSEDNGKITLARVTKTGEIIREVKVDNYIFNSAGIIVEWQNSAGDPVGRERKQLDFDLNEVKTIVGDSYYGDIPTRYIDKTGDFSVYSRYIKDEKTGERYYIAPSYLAYGAYIFNDDLYFSRDGTIYDLGNCVTVPAKNYLY